LTAQPFTKDEYWFVGEKMINVLQVNLELTKRYGVPQG